MHIETRKGASGKFQVYLEIESKSTDDWNNIRSLVETLNGIDIKPREDVNLVNQIMEEESEGKFFLLTVLLYYIFRLYKIYKMANKIKRFSSL